jgi:hypothetical protein
MAMFNSYVKLPEGTFSDSGHGSIGLERLEECVLFTGNIWIIWMVGPGSNIWKARCAFVCSIAPLPCPRYWRKPVSCQEFLLMDGDSAIARRSNVVNFTPRLPR